MDEASGSVCLDVINQTWSPMYDLVNIFSVFLPQLLLYPNPSDPLNGAAAALMFKDPEAYKQRIREHVKKHASVDFKLGDDDDDEDEVPVAAAANQSAAAAASSSTSSGSKNSEDDDEEDEDDDGGGDDEQVMSSEDEAAAMSDLDEPPEEQEVQA